MGFPGSASGKEHICQCKRCKIWRFNPRVGKIPWRRAWQPAPVFLTGEFHGQRSLVATVHRVAKSRTQMKWFTVCVCVCVCIYIYQRLILCQLLHLQLFSPILRLVFSSAVLFFLKLLFSIKFLSFIFVFISITLGGGSKRILLWFMSECSANVFL